MPNNKHNTNINNLPDCGQVAGHKYPNAEASSGSCIHPGIIGGHGVQPRQQWRFSNNPKAGKSSTHWGGGRVDGAGGGGA